MKVIKVSKKFLVPDKHCNDCKFLTYEYHQEKGDTAYCSTFETFLKEKEREEAPSLVLKCKDCRTCTVGRKK